MVSYREYLLEIENYTDQNMLDQVIAHSSHILKSYPNSIDALRFLGQAYLEQKKYNEASNCFERLLSFIPDDFVSHVGISSIKEEDRDLDAAIFHMEIAFDTQPSNVIVQEELKRLINKRDGSKPQKLNLSRGALIRMYIKGDLFQQALNEIEANLLSYPERIDIQVLQAKVYAQSNAKVQAVEVCNHILERLPYCLEPNQILHQIFLENGLLEQASQVQERLVSLDPYYKYIDSVSSKVDDIPDSKVEIEKLEYTSAFSSADVEYWSPPNNETNPITIPAPLQTEDPSSELPGSRNNVPDLIPDFLVNAGWEKTTNSQNELSHSIDDSSDLDLESPANLGELPDWLKNYTPGVNFSENAIITPSENQSGLGIIDEVDPYEEIVSNINIIPTDNLSSISEVEMTADNPQIPPSKDDSSDWMSQFFDEANKSSSEPVEEKGLPDWLKSFGQDDAPAEINKEDENPDWLKNLDSQIVQNESTDTRIDLNQDTSSNIDKLETVIDQKSPFPFESEVPDENKIDTSQEISLLSEPPSTDDDFLDILESLSFENPEVASSTSAFVDEKTDMTPISSDNSEGALPDWVKSVLSEPDEKTPELEAPLESIPDEKGESLDLTPNDLSSPSSLEDSIDTSEGAISQDAGDELLEWLRGISPVQSEIVTGDELESKITATTTSNSEVLEESLNRLEEISGSTSVILEESQTIAGDNESSLSLEELQPEVNIQSELEPEPTEFSNRNEELEAELLQDVELNPSLIEKFQSLLSTSSYPEAASMFSELNSAGIDPDKILETISSYKNEKVKDFDFLQFLGDTLAGFDHFDEAMDIYTQAEKILMGK